MLKGRPVVAAEGYVQCGLVWLGWGRRRQPKRADGRGENSSLWLETPGQAGQAWPGTVTSKVDGPLGRPVVRDQPAELDAPCPPVV